MDKRLLQKIQRMNDDELYQAIYCDTLTGVMNRRAYEEAASETPFVALIDIDSLKFINDNCGYRTGDRYLRNVAQTLEFSFNGEVYRLAGDEFAVTGCEVPELTRKLLLIRARLPVFSFGIGENLDAADTALKHDKKTRTLRGERANRCLAPPWSGQIIQ